MAYPFNIATLLPLLKIDLGITATAFDNRLTNALETAMERIEAEGATLENTASDRDLVLMYAAWLWRCRVDQAPMGRMLRQALNNRVIRETAEAAP